MACSLAPDMYNHWHGGEEGWGQRRRGEKGGKESWGKSRKRLGRHTGYAAIAVFAVVGPLTILQGNRARSARLPNKLPSPIKWKRESKRKLFIRKTEAHPVKKLSCTDQKCNHRRQALRVFQSLWGCINLKSCYIKEESLGEPPRVTSD